MSKVPAATHTLAILRLLMTTDAPISAARIATQIHHLPVVESHG